MAEISNKIKEKPETNILPSECKELLIQCQEHLEKLANKAQSLTSEACYEQHARPLVYQFSKFCFLLELKVEKPKIDNSNNNATALPDVNNTLNFMQSDKLKEIKFQVLDKVNFSDFDHISGVNKIWRNLLKSEVAEKMALKQIDFKKIIEERKVPLTEDQCRVLIKTLIKKFGFKNALDIFPCLLDGYPVHKAVMTGNLHIVKQVLNFLIEQDSERKWLNTVMIYRDHDVAYDVVPLTLAIILNYKNIVEYLASQKKGINAKFWGNGKLYLGSGLAEATDEKTSHDIKILSPLFATIQCGRPDFIAVLIKHGLNLKDYSDIMRFALSLRHSKETCSEVVAKLIEVGMDFAEPSLPNNLRFIVFQTYLARSASASTPKSVTAAIEVYKRYKLSVAELHLLVFHSYQKTIDLNFIQGFYKKVYSELFATNFLAKALKNTASFHSESFLNVAKKLYNEVLSKHLDKLLMISQNAAAKNSVQNFFQENIAIFDAPTFECVKAVTAILVVARELDKVDDKNAKNLAIKLHEFTAKISKLMGNKKDPQYDLIRDAMKDSSVKELVENQNVNENK